MKTVVAVLPSVEEAQHAAHDLKKLGVSPKEVSIVAGLEADTHELERVERARRTNGEAARSGATKGGIAGLVIGFALLSVPGVGPFLDGDFTATLAVGVAIVMASGALISLCWNMGRSHEEAPLYEEAVREHGTVVAAHVAADHEAPVMAVMQAHRGRAVEAAGDAWAASGSREHYEHAYPCDSSVVAHTGSY